jgi:hypothetical protein
LHRRQFLKVGGTGLIGLSWSVMYKADPLAAEARTERKAGGAVIIG